MIGLFDKEHKIRIAGSCAFDDWFGVHEASVGEAVTMVSGKGGIFGLLQLPDNFKCTGI